MLRVVNGNDTVRRPETVPNRGASLPGARHSCSARLGSRISRVKCPSPEPKPDPRDSRLTNHRLLDRRAMLRQSLAAGGALLAAGCLGVRRSVRDTTAPPRSWAKVLVSRDRVIREVTGLRPFRAPGFVVRAEALGDRTVVHNYGHGGGGISLCWGSSELAVELASATGHRRLVARRKSRSWTRTAVAIRHPI